MPVGKRKCPYCKAYNKPEEGFMLNNRLYCSLEHAVAYGKKTAPKAKGKREKALRAENKARKMDLKPRGYWYKKLQLVVNQWVVQVRDKNKPCCTCGTSDPNIKYDAGHRYHAGRGGGDRRRFEPKNIHKQCSMICNHHGSGMPAEYDRFLDANYGEGTAEWLREETNHKTLKEQFPNTEDIKNEISRYKELLKSEGLTPRT